MRGVGLKAQQNLCLQTEEKVYFLLGVAKFEK